MIDGLGTQGTWDGFRPAATSAASFSLGHAHRLCQQTSTRLCFAAGFVT